MFSPKRSNLVATQVIFACCTEIPYLLLFQVKQMTIKDLRIKLMNEILNGIKVSPACSR